MYGRRGVADGCDRAGQELQAIAEEYAPMMKTLAKHGNSLALVLDRAILDLVKIDPADPVEISTDDGQRLIITPVKDAKRRNKFRAALEGVNHKHVAALKRLAE